MKKISEKGSLRHSISRNQVEFFRIESKTRKFLKVCDVVKHGLTICGALGCMGVMGYTLRHLSGAEAGVIDSLARFVRSWRLDSLVLALGNVFFVGLWRRERHGKKRAVEQKALYQQRAESGEPARTSSGLTARGDTPTGEG